jgi:hypothetical protein
MHLSHLPVEIWHELNLRLNFFSILRLYACGNSQLNHLFTVRGAIDDVYLHFGYKTKELRWLPLFSQLTGLRKFHYHCGSVTHNACYFPTKADLMRLGPRLEHFLLYSDGAENAFWADEQATPGDHGCLTGTHISVAELWPNLRTFNVTQYSGTGMSVKEFGEVKRTFPSSLTCLNLRIHDDEPYLPYLPKTLTELTLRITKGMKLEELGQLPPMLEYLNTNLASTSMGPNISPDDVEHFSKLPRSITKLRFVIPETLLAPNEVLNRLPTGLLWLDLSSLLKPDSFHLIASRFPSLSYLHLVDRRSLGIDFKHPDLTMPLRYIATIRHGQFFFFWDKSKWSTKQSFDVFIS